MQLVYSNKGLERRTEHLCLSYVSSIETQFYVNGHTRLLKYNLSMFQGEKQTKQKRKSIVKIILDYLLCLLMLYLLSVTIYFTCLNFKA